MEKQNGITLVSLVTTVILLSILTGTISISILKIFEMKKYIELKDDIEFLDDKVAIYYLENGMLPVNDNEEINIYDLIENYSEENVNYNPNNNEILYKIDIEKLNIQDLNNDEFYIDEQSHTVYCKNACRFNEKIYYTLHHKYNKIQ